MFQRKIIPQKEVETIVGILYDFFDGDTSKFPPSFLNTQAKVHAKGQRFSMDALEYDYLVQAVITKINENPTLYKARPSHTDRLRACLAKRNAKYGQIPFERCTIHGG